MSNKKRSRIRFHDIRSGGHQIEETLLSNQSRERDTFRGGSYDRE